jgi:hypothetical protein
MLEELKAMKEEFAELKKAHLEKSKVMFTNITTKLFDKHPKLVSFGWRQYTPYFNDGEECTFSAHTDEPDINGINGYDVNFGDEMLNDYSKERDPVTKQYPKIKNPSYDLELHAAHKDVEEFLDNIDDSVLRDLFGDHVEVTVKKDGTEVEEHEHD